ncbi:ectoine utilization protein EutA [Aurantimonas sp. 22II-16-19i]|uniref:ectoine utilization protein EutA n=1 Tax=Aurantimonas sp. 22II-16-19i TaxID=1317114 RepID=UPI0009F7A11B|nr:ectoine utilization protein EutA [Aurantimonas sp. 22II-16-19i]ORE98941.1 arylmalonate decarboxylase [Aurantimonas sp. 22II-16-19i]
MTTMRELSPSAVNLDERPIARRVGLILLSTDHTTETDFARLVAGEGIGVYANRIEYANPTTPENLLAMRPRLAEAAAAILPGSALDAVCFSCSSASAVIGDLAVTEAVQAGKPGVSVVTPALAAAKALTALGARRIAMLTPYLAATTRPLADYVEAKGFELAAVTCLGFDDDRVMARISRAALVEAAVAAMPDDAEALFISCTALRAVSVVAEIEGRIGRPVVTSNQATIWECLHHCEAAPKLANAGRLFGHTLAKAA